MIKLKSFDKTVITSTHNDFMIGCRLLAVGDNVCIGRTNKEIVGFLKEAKVPLQLRFLPPIQENSGTSAKKSL